MGNAYFLHMIDFLIMLIALGGFMTVLIDDEYKLSQVFFHCAWKQYTF